MHLSDAVQQKLHNRLGMNARILLRLLYKRFALISPTSHVILASTLLASICLNALNHLDTGGEHENVRPGIAQSWATREFTAVDSALRFFAHPGAIQQYPERDSAAQLEKSMRDFLTLARNARLHYLRFGMPSSGSTSRWKSARMFNYSSSKFTQYLHAAVIEELRNAVLFNRNTYSLSSNSSVADFGLLNSTRTFVSAISEEWRAIYKQPGGKLLFLLVYVLLALSALAIFYIKLSRKRARIKLAHELNSAAVYTRSLIEAGVDPLMIINLQGRITDVNVATEKITGKSRSELIGTVFSGHFADPDRARDGYQQTLGKGKLTDYPLVMRHMDGHVTSVLYNASVYRNEAGEVVGVCAGAHDVTEREQTEAIRNQLAAIVEYSNDALISKTPDGIITSWNKSAERIYGYSAGEIIGKHITVLVPPSRHVETHDFLERIRHGETVANHESERIRKDGTVIHVALSLSPIKDTMGNIIGISAVTRDITEKKLLEERMHQASVYNRSLIEASLDPMVTISQDGKITDVNAATEKVTGRNRAELIGTDFSDYFTVPDKARAGYQQVLHEGALTDYPLAIRHRDGHITEVLYNASLYRDEAGKTIGVFAAARDVTEHKRTEEELREYKDHLEEQVLQRTADLVLARNAAEAANKAKSVFLASMSHELRTPLNAILGFSNMMRRDRLLSDSQRQNLDIINRSGEHLLTLINDVLEMAKIEAGGVQLENAPFDLGSMVRDVTDMMNERAGEKGLQLVVDQSSRFPRYIIGDEARLRQVLINLVGNAVKFTQRGGVTLRLRTTRNKISLLQFEVEDSGLGIAPEDQQRIFEPFVQLGEQEGNKGTGLGLTITRQFVQLMGGSISLESTPGKGSRFMVDLPLAEVMEADIVKQKEAEKGEVVGLAPGQPEYRILIVEDQRDNQLLLTRLMESVGFQVKVAGNGEQGVQLFQSWHPHFIWMDRRMPVMDGLEATRHIRELPGGKEVKIVGVTASAFIEQRNEMLNAGLDDFVRKPYRFNELYECLSKQLGASYIYKGVPESQQQAAILTPEMLTVLPEGLRTELNNALESLESERIELVIRQVAAYDKKLEKTLSYLAENFDYSAILHALGTNGSGSI